MRLENAMCWAAAAALFVGCVAQGVWFCRRRRWVRAALAEATDP